MKMALYDQQTSTFIKRIKKSHSDSATANSQNWDTKQLTNSIFTQQFVEMQRNVSRCRTV